MRLIGRGLGAERLFSGSEGGARQVSERIAELAEQAARHLAVDDAEDVRDLTFRQMEGTESQVKKWKGRSEVLVASLIGIGVMPTVKNRARQDVAGTGRTSSSGSHAPEGRTAY